MKMLRQIGFGCVCLSLLFTLGCNNNNSGNKNTSTTKTTAITATKATVSSTKTPSTTTPSASASPISTTSYTPSRTGPFDGGFSSDKPLLFELYTGEGTGDEGDPYTAQGKTAMQLDETEKTFAGQFFATTNINYIETFCPSWSNDAGNMTLSIYNWRGTYQATISSSAIKSLEFVDYLDNSWLQLKFDTPLPSGEYLWVLSNPIEQVGIWDVPDGPVDHLKDVKCYISGEVIDTYHIFRIQYAKTPKITLVELSK